MKKFMYLALLLTSLSASATTPPEITKEVLKAFKETFIDADNVQWTEMENKCQADFLIAEIRVKAIYKNDGSLLQTFRYYQERHLPGQVLANVKKKYSGKEITGVTEISTESEISYHIVIKDENYYYMVQSDPYGSLTLTQKLKRADLMN